MAIVLSWAFQGCKVGPDYHRPSAPVPVKYKELKGWIPGTPANGLDRSDWWVVYNDPVLNKLEEEVGVDGHHCNGQDSNSVATAKGRARSW